MWNFHAIDVPYSRSHLTLTRFWFIFNISFFRFTEFESCSFTCRKYYNVNQISQKFVLCHTCKGGYVLRVYYAYDKTRKQTVQRLAIAVKQYFHLRAYISLLFLLFLLWEFVLHSTHHFYHSFTKPLTWRNL